MFARNKCLFELLMMTLSALPYIEYFKSYYEAKTLY